MKKVKIYHICIVAVLVIQAVFCYYAISYIRARILIRQPILADYNDSDREILQNELGIEFVDNTTIIESKYTPGIDPSFHLIFSFPESNLEAFLEGITGNYIYVPARDRISSNQNKSAGTFLKGFCLKTDAFTSLDVYKSSPNQITTYIIFSDPGKRLTDLLMNKVK